MPNPASNSVKQLLITNKFVFLQPFSELVRSHSDAKKRFRIKKSFGDISNVTNFCRPGFKPLLVLVLSWGILYSPLSEVGEVVYSLSEEKDGYLHIYTIHIYFYFKTALLIPPSS